MCLIIRLFFNFVLKEKSVMKKEKILITGALGQLGSVLTRSLQAKYGIKNTIASDLKVVENFEGCYEVLDATNFDAISKCVVKHEITQIFHLAAILSANGEKNPLSTWDINMKTLFNVLEASKAHHVKKVFYPSSIAVFGPNLESSIANQITNLTPTTVYGISKAAGENWANYYYLKYGLDVRSIRYPGVIGYETLPGGGTTDYAVDIYHKAVKNEVFSCFLKPDTVLPMIYMDDAIRATLELMDAPREKISVRTSYNIASMSFSPKELYDSIKRLCPEFKIEYAPDHRQEIASSWPNSIDDSQAIKDWGWKPKYNLEDMSQIMIEKLKEHYNSVIA